MSDHIPAAWYPDPDDDGASERWWDGSDWSETTRTRTVPTPVQKSRPTPGPATTTVVRKPAEVALTVDNPAASAPHLPQPAQPAPVAPPVLRRFYFDGGAATYVGTGLLAFLITVFTFGVCTPFAIVLRQRWRAKHTFIQGHRLIFVGSAVGLFGHFIKWWALIILTLGIYSFWVIPRMTKWVVENTDYDPAWRGLPG
jgi:hypothetical protein